MPESRATMRGIPGDAARRRGLRRVLVPVACFAGALGVGAGLLLGGVGVPWWLGATVFAAALGGFALYRRRQPALVYGYFKGARGEEMVAGELAHLPSAWTIFNGLLLPDGRDVDHGGGLAHHAIIADGDDLNCQIIGSGIDELDLELGSRVCQREPFLGSEVSTGPLMP